MGVINLIWSPPDKQIICLCKWYLLLLFQAPSPLSVGCQLRYYWPPLREYSMTGRISVFWMCLYSFSDMWPGIKDVRIQTLSMWSVFAYLLKPGSRIWWFSTKPFSSILHFSDPDSDSSPPAPLRHTFAIKYPFCKRWPEAKAWRVAALALR